MKKQTPKTAKLSPSDETGRGEKRERADLPRQSPKPGWGQVPGKNQNPRQRQGA
jgi:hypothetical protein